MAETLKKAQEERQRLINDTVLWETPAGEVVSIYEGSFIAGMKELDREKFQWKLYAMLGNQNPTGLPVGAVSYECGNYADGDWDAVGKTKGYA